MWEEAKEEADRSAGEIVRLNAQMEIVAMEAGGGAANNLHIMDLEDKLDKADKKIKGLEDEIEEFEQNEEKVQNAMNAKQVEVQQAKKSILMLEEQLAGGDANEAIKDLKEDLEESNRRCARMKKAVEDVSMDRDNIKAEFDEIDQELATSQNNIEQLQQANQQFQQQFQSIQEQLVHVTTEREHLMEQQEEGTTELKSLRKQVAKYEKENELLHSQLSSSQEAGNHHSKKLDKFNEQIINQRAEIEQLKGKLERSKLEQNHLQDKHQSKKMDNAVESKERLIFEASDEIERLKGIIDSELIRNWILSQKGEGGSGGSGSLGMDESDDGMMPAGWQ